MDWKLFEQLGIQAPVVLDSGPKIWFFKKPYTVTIEERSEWVSGLHELTRQELVWFTDGPESERGIGATAWRQGSKLKVVCKLDTCDTIFQAEVRAI